MQFSDGFLTDLLACVDRTIREMGETGDKGSATSATRYVAMYLHSKYIVYVPH